MKLHSLILLSSLSIFLFGCGGGSSSGTGDTPEENTPQNQSLLEEIPSQEPTVFFDENDNPIASKGNIQNLFESGIYEFGTSYNPVETNLLPSIIGYQVENDVFAQKVAYDSNFDRSDWEEENSISSISHQIYKDSYPQWVSFSSLSPEDQAIQVTFQENTALYKTFQGPNKQAIIIEETNLSLQPLTDRINTLLEKTYGLDQPNPFGTEIFDNEAKAYKVLIKQTENSYSYYNGPYNKETYKDNSGSYHDYTSLRSYLDNAQNKGDPIIYYLSTEGEYHYCYLDSNYSASAVEGNCSIYMIYDLTNMNGTEITEHQAKWKIISLNGQDVLTIENPTVSIEYAEILVEENSRVYSGRKEIQNYQYYQTYFNQKAIDNIKNKYDFNLAKTPPAP